jgi:CheY-like chemotaxis protein
LIVEDNLDSARALATLVADIGHEVKTAINGYAALDIARQFKPHFVLLDLGLPGMDGYEVCLRMTREADLAGTRIIALTAYGRAEHRLKSLTAGCERHVLKPISAQALFDLLESSLAAAPHSARRQ